MSGAGYMHDFTFECALIQNLLLLNAGRVKGGWEAAFGPLKPQQKAAGDRKQPAQGEAEALPRVQDLWDAPSHALPAPSVLVGASLEALLAGVS